MIAVLHNPAESGAVAAVAARLGLPVVQAAPDQGLVMERTAGRWQLRDTAKPAQRPVFVDFDSARSHYRRTHGGGRGQALARAAGVGKAGTAVVDATAGFGSDAFVLASLGCEVTMIERNAAVAVLLEDGLQRAARTPAIAAIAARMTLVCADAVAELAQLPVRPHQVVYLDPMYPPTRKHAAVRKEMALLRHIIGAAADNDALLAAALSTTAARVVVKRPRGAPALGTEPASTLIRTPNTRYDIYIR